MSRTIKVTGKGCVRLKPDLIIVNIVLQGVRNDYDEVLKESARQVELLKDCFEGIGLARTDLKTLDFNVDTENESQHDKKGNWVRKFVGYKFSHNMKIEFDADDDLLGKALSALANVPVNPEFSISYTVRDVEKAKNQLLKAAVLDSKEKAVVLTEAAGVTLGDILVIDYSWGEIDFVSGSTLDYMSFHDACLPCGGSIDMDIEPDDIKVSDTVTVVWEIR